MQVEYQYPPQFIDAGYLVDITEYVGQYEDFFVPWTWSQCVRDGKVYAMPQDRGPLAFLYRPDIFEEYGYTVPTTYDQMAEEAAKLHEANPDMYYTHFPTNDPGKVIGFIWQAGGRPFHFDSAANQWQVSINDDASKSVMTYWGDLIDNGLVKASPDFTPEFNAEIGDGLYASLIAPAWFFPNYGAPYTTEETGYWNVAPIPQWDPSNPSNGNWGGSTYGVTTQSKNPEAAALFVAWVSASKEIAELDIAEDGRSLVPASIFWEELDGFNNPDPIYSNQSDVNQIYLDASELVDNTFEWSPWTDFVFNSYNEEITKASEGQIPWDQLLDNVQNNTVAFAESMGYSVVSSSGNSGSSPQENVSLLLHVLVRST